MIFQMRTMSKLWLCLPALFALQAVAENEDVVVNLLLSPTVDMIDASWELENSTGVVSKYRVSWQTTGDSISSCSVNNSSSNTSDCDERPSLSSCTFYTVTVQPQKYDGRTFVETGTPASASNNTLPEVPPAIVDVQIIDVQSRSISLEWARPETNSCITLYFISYQEEILWCCQSSTNRSVFAEDCNDTEPTVKAVLQDLTPYSNYSITVAAVTEAGKGEDSPPVNTQTDEDVPGSPYSVEARTLNSSNMEVNWELPEEKNGIITHYTVRWKIDNTITVYSESVPGDVLNYEVADLEECLLYQFSVTASTSAGEGEEAFKKDSPMASETEAPEVACIDISWTTEVTWSIPNATCPIDCYEIHYTYDVLWSDDEGSEWLTVSASENLFELENTTPYSKYTYEVMAIVAGEVNGPEGTCIVQTSESVPSAPQRLTLDKYSYNSLTIRWNPPAMANGIVRSYRISWRSEHSSSAIGDTVPADPGQSSFMYTIYDLNQNTGYVVEVTAETIYYGVPASGTFYTALHFIVSTSSSTDDGLIVLYVFIAAVLVAALLAVIVKRKDIRARLKPTRHGSSEKG